LNLVSALTFGDPMKSTIPVLLLTLLASACGSSAVSPSPGSAGNLGSMSGVWSGAAADSTGQERMTWTVTQDGNSLSGMTSVTDAGRSMTGAGTMRGTVKGRTVSFHMDVPNGGFTGMMASCVMAADGEATMSADGRTITGTYAG
jgi:hypothetical protein